MMLFQHSARLFRQSGHGGSRRDRAAQWLSRSLANFSCSHVAYQSRAQAASRGFVQGGSPGGQHDRGLSRRPSVPQRLHGGEA